MLIALSGGADSRMLFELAARHCRLHSTHFFACHVNHGIRGDEAIRDRDFCISLAEGCDECRHIFVLNADVPALAAERGLGIEQCARQVRYDFFDRVMSENAIEILVTAHNADDSLETMVFNLARGSGARGMCGIPPVRSLKSGVLIRPMLGISKADVLEFCRQNRLDYVTDSTNAQTEYTRNLIRAEIIPVLTEINPSVRAAASRMALAMSELWSMTADLASKYVRADGIISLPELKSADPRLIPYVISAAADTVGVDLEAVHIDAVRSLIATGTDGKSLSLPGGFRAKLIGERLILEKDEHEEAHGQLLLPFKVGTTDLPWGSVNVRDTGEGYLISMSVFPDEKKFSENINVYKLDITAHIIFDKIKWPIDRLCLRTRATGDKILSGGVRKSVKKLMCDKKLPRVYRDVIPMLTCGDEILWVPSVQTADRIKIKKTD